MVSKTFKAARHPLSADKCNMEVSVKGVSSHVPKSIVLIVNISAALTRLSVSALMWEVSRPKRSSRPGEAEVSAPAEAAERALRPPRSGTP